MSGGFMDTAPLARDNMFHMRCTIWALITTLGSQKQPTDLPAELALDREAGDPRPVAPVMLNSYSGIGINSTLCILMELEENQILLE